MRKLKRFLINLLLVALMLILLIPQKAFGQELDSLFNAFQQSDNQAERLKTANTFFLLFYESGNSRNKNQFTASDDERMIYSRIYSAMGNYVIRTYDDHEQAAGLYEKSIEYSRMMGDSMRICGVMQNLYGAYMATGKSEKAFLCMQESLELAYALNDEESIAYGLLVMGDFYLRNKKSDLAEDYFKKSLDIYRRRGNMEMSIAAMDKLSGIFLNKGNVDDLRKIAKMAEQYSGSDMRHGTELALLQIFANANEAEHDFDKTCALLDSCLAIAEENNMINHMSPILERIGNLSFRNGWQEKAIYYLQRNIQLCIDNNIPWRLQSTYSYLSRSMKNENPVLAVEYMEKYIALRDSLYMEQFQEELGDLSVKYETKEKENQILLQQAELKRKDTLRNILLVISSLFLVILFVVNRYRILVHRRNTELKDMNATKDKFFSIISHDLKNPAIAQRDALQLLINNTGKWDATLLSQYYNELLSSADNQVELLYNLLNWAQVQTGRMPYKPVPFDLVSALHSDIALIENMSKRKGVVFNVEMPEFAVITGDSNMLVTIVRNLLTNAVKYTSSGDSVTLCIKLMPDSNYTVSVSDSGIGISDEQLRNLFVLDNKQSRRGTNGESGNGLGLIVCKELLEKHGSTLLVESREGEGSRFWFVLNSK